MPHINDNKYTTRQQFSRIAHEAFLLQCAMNSTQDETYTLYRKTYAKICELYSRYIPFDYEVYNEIDTKYLKGEMGKDLDIFIHSGDLDAMNATKIHKKHPKIWQHFNFINFLKLRFSKKRREFVTNRVMPKIAELLEVQSELSLEVVTLSKLSVPIMQFSRITSKQPDIARKLVEESSMEIESI